MNYMTTSETANLWGISKRRVQDYCKKGKIKGATMLGDRWLVPKNATKPLEKVGRPKKSNNPNN